VPIADASSRSKGPYLITPLARASIIARIVRSRAFAVLRLITSSSAAFARPGRVPIISFRQSTRADSGDSYFREKGAFVRFLRRSGATIASASISNCMSGCANLLTAISVLVGSALLKYL
jgi:hypothetical protein